MATGSNPGGDLREQPIGELFKQLSDDLSTLVRQELKLAQAEMTEKGKKAGIGAGLFRWRWDRWRVDVGHANGVCGRLVGDRHGFWVAALVMTVVYGALAGVLALTGKKRVSEATPPVPEQTVETVKEDVQWAKTQLPSGSK
jgi:Putative Actinobacterial Holin-X, holin superfamily III